MTYRKRFLVWLFTVFFLGGIVMFYNSEAMEVLQEQGFWNSYGPHHPSDH